MDPTFDFEAELYLWKPDASWVFATVPLDVSDEIKDIEPPRDIVEVWLFGDARSYRRHALAIFGDRPDTPYGYFTPEHQALVMNIATGGGTLVHELVHPYIDNDFPRCPSWLDEGLASLFEQCQDHGGHIWGLTNWRLPGLQEAIAAGRWDHLERYRLRTPLAVEGFRRDLGLAPRAG